MELQLRNLDFIRQIFSTPPAREDSLSEAQWAKFLEFSESHLFAGPVAASILAEELTDVPELVYRFCTSILELNGIRNRQIMSVIEDAGLALNESGITPVFFKGAAALLCDIYAEPSHRFLSDIDLLIPDMLGDQAIEALENAGFVRTDPNDFVVPHCIEVMVCKRRGVAIDLHREILIPELQPILPCTDMLANVEKRRLPSGLRFAVPSPTHQVVINVAHGQLQDRSYLWNFQPLKYLYELHRLEKRYQDAIKWEEVTSRFATAGHRAPLELHRYQAARLFDTDNLPDVSFRVRLKYGCTVLMTENEAIFWVYSRLFSPFVWLRDVLSDRVRLRRTLHKIRRFSWWRERVRRFFSSEPRVMKSR